MESLPLLPTTRAWFRDGMRWVLLICASMTMSCSPVALAEFVVSSYGGKSWTLDSKVALQQTDNTHLTFNDVSWNDEAFKSPIYYGARLTYWLGRKSNWGFEAEFIHAKMVAELEETVTVSGTRNGIPVSGQEGLDQSFDQLEFSHGHNLLLLNAKYRWIRNNEHDNILLGRMQPYLGLGAGMAIPHVEITTQAGSTGDYQLAGPALQGLVGVNFDVSDFFSLFTEYKLTYADIEADLNEGGSLHVEPITNHLVLGASLNF